jgi:hypothetical protein
MANNLAIFILFLFTYSLDKNIHQFIAFYTRGGTNPSFVIPAPNFNIFVRAIVKNNMISIFLVKNENKNPIKRNATMDI